MNVTRWIKANHLKSVTLLILSGFFVASCGSSGGGSSDQVAGVGGTGIAVGKTTGFGSIFVNGIQFETGSSEFVVDGNAMATQDDLALGMVVTVTAETESGSFNGVALKVVYDDEVEGPVAATPVEVPGSNGTQKTFDVFGQTITIDSTATLYEDIGFDTLDAGDIVEISGFRESPTQIRATYVKKTGDLVLTVSEVELRGIISNYMAGPPETFVVDGVTITTHPGTIIDVPNGILQNGLNVEVEGVIQTPTSVLADEIEFEEEGFGNEVEDVSLQGVIANYVDDSNFEIDGQAVDASGALFFPPGAVLTNGLEVEVEGDIVGGILIADELEVREGETEIETFVSLVDVAGNRFEVSFGPLPGSIVVNVDAQTTFDDDAGAMPLENMTLNDLAVGNFVKIEGQEINDEVLASVVKREDISEADELKLEGAVDDHLDENWIEVLGIRYTVNGSTNYEDQTGPITSTQFYLQLVNGDLVEIEDDNDPLPADGIADEVELED